MNDSVLFEFRRLTSSGLARSAGPPVPFDSCGRPGVWWFAASYCSNGSGPVEFSLFFNLGSLAPPVLCPWVAIWRRSGTAVGLHWGKGPLGRGLRKKFAMY
jgi:hypothetical protein